jgi:hypothetical protein
MSILRKVVLAPFNTQPVPLPTREELNQEWEEILEWLRIEDIPLPKEDAPIGSYLERELLDADAVQELRAHEKRLRREFERMQEGGTSGGNGAYYKLRCLRIVVGLVALAEASSWTTAR